MRLFSLHLGREVSIYAFCSTVAAKVNLVSCLNVLPSGERPVWPDGEHLNDVSSGERQVWPDGMHLNDVSSGEKRVWPDGSALKSE